MALNGTFYGTTNTDKVKPKIVWSATQSIAGNYSDVTATLYYSRTNTGYTTAGMWSGSITIDESTKSESRNLSITYNSNTQAITHTARIYHDSFGAKKILIRATGGISISSMTSTDISATVTLDTIARASSISAVNGDIGSRVTVVIDRKNSAFSHSVHFKMGACQGYIKSDGLTASSEQKFTGTTVNFLVPESFYAEIPNATSGKCTLTCRTYNGANLIGTTTATFTATASKTACAPTVLGEVSDVNEKTLALTGNASILVDGQSTARCTITATAKNSATITQKTIGGVAVTNNSRTIANIQQGSILFTAKDSRGYQSQEPESPTFIPYVSLTCDPVARRTNPTDGKARLVIKGKCYQGSFGAKSNALQLSYQIGGDAPVTVSATVQDDNSYSVTVALSGMDYTQSYAISVTAADALCTVTKTVQLQKGLPVFDWGKSDFAFHVPVTGDFHGTFDGLYVRTVRKTGDAQIELQSYYDEFDSDYTSKQTIFLFGTVNTTPVHGMVTVLASGSDPLWSGTGAVTTKALEGGRIRLTLPNNAWDTFTFLSAYYFEIL